MACNLPSGGVNDAQTLPCLGPISRGSLRSTVLPC